MKLKQLIIKQVPYTYYRLRSRITRYKVEPARRISVFQTLVRDMDWEQGLEVGSTSSSEFNSKSMAMVWWKGL